jgi:hypothetical protein
MQSSGPPSGPSSDPPSDPPPDPSTAPVVAPPPAEFPAPAAPAFPAAHLATVERFPRYEDCTQDGRLITTAIPPALATLWETALARHPGVRNARIAGVVSLLTRMTVTSLDQPIRVHHPTTAAVGFELAHDRDPAGAVARLYMNVWAEVRGVAGRHGSGAPPAS